MRVPTEETMAHFLSPATLALSTDGRLVVKTVDDEDVVVAHTGLHRARAERTASMSPAWPDTAGVITIGQGFVNDGDTVAPQPDERDAPEPGDDPQAVTQAPDTQAPETGTQGDAQAVSPLDPADPASELFGDDAQMPSPGAQ